MKPPTAAVPLTPVLTEELLLGMLKATRGEFHRRRAEACYACSSTPAAGCPNVAGLRWRTSL